MARRKSAPTPIQSAPVDQREAQRFTLILRAGKLVTEHGEFLCVLRDVSSGGLKLKLFHPLPCTEPCQIELAGGERYALEAAWHEGDHAGFRFAESPVDIGQLLEEAGPFPKRSIRLRLRDPVPIALHGSDLALQAKLHDISQHGMALTCGKRLPIGQRLEVSAPLLGVVDARVRWRRGDCFGLVFQQSFRLDDLARIAARLQPHEPSAPAQIKTASVNH